jgi:methanesulfonate monooxygenase subunit beta
MSDASPRRSPTELERSLAHDLIYELSLRLDADDFAGYLERCAPDLRYTIGAYSPELRKPMLWLDLDKPGLRTLFDTLPRHHSDHARLSRHVTVYKVEGPRDVDEGVRADGGGAGAGRVTDAGSGAGRVHGDLAVVGVDTLQVVSAMQVFRTVLDGGATTLFAVGKIFDNVRLDPETRAARLVRRRIELETRMLGIGSHLPL